MQSLRQKTTNGLIWSFIESISGQGVQFLVGIILARLLSPNEFGIIGILTIFITFSQTFVESGFTSALIRKQDCTKDDYSTVFVYNVIISVILYLLLYFSANLISRFFLEPILVDLIKIVGIGIIINSFCSIPRTILVKNIDFKTQAKISIIAAAGSGVISILCALYNFGIWSLVILVLLRYLITSFFLWIWTRWELSFRFKMSSFKELFGYGSKMLLSGLIDTTYRNINYIIIGKYFSPFDLGQYTRAEQFNAIPSQNLVNIVGRVTYPVLASLQDDKILLKRAYIKIIRSTMFLTFLSMLILSAISKSLTFVLIGDKWTLAGEYLQLLSIVGMFYPLHSLNLNILQVHGRSDLFLKLEIIKKILAIPIIVIGITLGIKFMLIAMIVNSLISYYLNSYWSAKIIDYSTREQVKDILPSLKFALIVSFLVYFVNYIEQINQLLILVIQLLLAIILIFVLGELIKFKEYLEAKAFLYEKLNIMRK